MMLKIHVISLRAFMERLSDVFDICLQFSIIGHVENTYNIMCNMNARYHMNMDHHYHHINVRALFMVRLNDVFDIYLQLGIKVNT